MSAGQLPILEFDHPEFQPGRNTTVRRGRRWHGVGHARIRWADGSLSAPLRLVTELRPFRSLQSHDLAREHDPACRTPEGLLVVLQRLYPGFSPEEEVTLCHFDLP
jgi:hypothetical protein